jgi:hypothetical protein
VVAFEEFDDVETGDYLIAIRLQLVPAVVCESIGRHRQGAEANAEGEGGTG